MLPFVSCICPTYARPPAYQHLLEEAVESFLRQDYPVARRELIVVNDCRDQELEWPDELAKALGPALRIYNYPRRFSSLGDKYNWAIRYAAGAGGDLICPWEDDDISLPWRITQAVEHIGMSDYWKPPQVWYLQAGQPPLWNHTVGVRHHAGIFRRAAWSRVGGYAPISGAQDGALDKLLGGSTLPAFPEGLPPRAWAYVYRWGVQPLHLSGQAPHDVWYEVIGRKPVERGSFILRPQWRADYVALCQAALG